MDNELKPYNISVTSSHPRLVKIGLQETADLHGANTRLLRFYPIISADFEANKSYSAMIDGKRVVIHGVLKKIATGSKLIPWQLIIPITRWAQESSGLK